MKNLKFVIVVLVLAVAVLLGFMMTGSFSDSPAVPDNADPSPVSGDSLSFSTTALDGSSVDESIFEGQQLIMLNFWESWCGPCVSEMPELERLYQDYKDKGFLLIGVYSTEDGVQDVIGSLGISYPIIKFCDSFAPFQTGYVPTTVFLDADGNVLGEPVVGANSYEGWAAMVDSLLAK